VGIYENKQLVFVAKVKNGFVPRIRDDLITDSRSTDLELPGIRFRQGRGHWPIERYEYASESESSECGQGEERFLCREILDQSLNGELHVVNA
jgi:hypothetical protein